MNVFHFGERFRPQITHWYCESLNYRAPTAMNQRRQREEELFTAALESGSDAKRKLFVHKACRADAEFRACLESLLGAHRHARGFLDSPAETETDPPPNSIVRTNPALPPNNGVKSNEYQNTDGVRWRSGLDRHLDTHHPGRHGLLGDAGIVGRGAGLGQCQWLRFGRGWMGKGSRPSRLQRQLVRRCEVVQCTK